ncbi:MAG: T9SS type A sorting domain-containing protein [candidate division Zixibacteria bacterium]|nr:T9SS type A sorting domain-containing protein [candidate division Zixibacteria bacterium]
MKLLSLIFIVIITNYNVGTTAGIVWEEHVIDNFFRGAWDIYAADLDNDGDKDIIGTTWAAVIMAWWENDGNQQFTKRVFDPSFTNALCVHADDVDSDDDIDVLGTSYYANEISVWENSGNGNFTKHIISEDFSGACCVYSVDLDSDDDIDIIGAAQLDDEIAWWESNGSWNWTKHIVEIDYDNARCVSAADIDGDTDIDIVGAAQGSGEISWWENDGSENFTKRVIAGVFNEPFEIYLADMDVDNDTDVLAAGASQDEIAWWENDGDGNFTKHVIDNVDNPQSVFAIDVDGDTDIDVVGTSRDQSYIAWWERKENNQGESFVKHILRSDYSYARGVYATDMDQDTDTDILGVSYQLGEVTWWELFDYPACDAEVSMIPDEEPVVIPAGGAFWYTGVVGNPNDYGVNTDAWVTVSLNGYTFYVGRFMNNVIDPYGEISVHLKQEIPYSAPIGDYIYKSNCGDFYGWQSCDVDSFIFTVTEPEGFPENLEWNLIGNSENTEPVPEELELVGNYPNPFNASTTISYTLPEASRVRMDIYNLRGQRIETLVDGAQQAGEYFVTWDASQVASGVYFYKLTAGKNTFTKKMSLLK